ncbi:radical SAM protein [Lentzea sp. JNUCC 0626]|uniref:radical SAM protein n=1 Tax=Lentzea sp. JNUCC 0626 TaxID=3367513 RepID=UPI00374907F7
MRLAEIMALRQDVCAGVLVTLTERCPLHCAHCSFAAGLRGRHLDADHLLRFVSTLDRRRPPQLLMLTGGEPLLRPDLVARTALAANTAGTRTAVLTGAFFARGGDIPAPIRRAARAVDHLSLSLDVFHEREVPRADVFEVLRALLRDGTATSLHVTGTGPDDPYLAEVTAQVETEFGEDVPMLVAGVQPLGRAASWAQAVPVADGSVAPCATAAWPVIAVDGVVVACCNQDVVDGRMRPDHLVLGDIARSDWADVQERAQARPVLRMVRTVGPLHIAARAQANCASHLAAAAPATGTTDTAPHQLSPAVPHQPSDSPARQLPIASVTHPAPPPSPTPSEPGSYCGTCHLLPHSPGALAWATRAGSGPVGELLQAAARDRSGGPQALLRRHGIPRYAHLVGGEA